MSNLTSKISEGETIYYRARASWLLGFFWALVWASIGVYIMINLRGLFIKLIFSKTERILITYTPFVLAAYKIILCFLNILKTKVFITNYRILTKHGLLFPKKLDLERTKIQGVFIFQPFWGKFLNFGTLYIVHKNGTQYNVKRISSPFKFLKQFLIQK
jgi:hypothetical protein